MNRREQIYQNIADKRQRLIEGKVNSIPSPFRRFSNDFIGLQQGRYVLITSFTKAGKSQFASYLLFEALMFLYHSIKNGKDIDLKIKIFWCALEETPERITLRFISWLLNKMSDYRLRYSPQDLDSAKNDKILPQEVLDFINRPEFIEIVDFFNDHITFIEQTHPTGIWKEVEAYCKKNGTVEEHMVPTKDESGNLHEIPVFDRYIPDDPSEYVFLVVDTLNLLSPEQNLSKKQTIDKMSEYAIRLRNRYNVSPLFIQQQNTSAESLDAQKMGKTRPTTSSIGDSTNPPRDCNIAIGIFNPSKFGINDFAGYRIDRFKDHFRSIEVLISRDGEIGGMAPLFFDGATCNWFELPLPSDISAMSKVYHYLDSLNATPSATYVNHFFVKPKSFPYLRSSTLFNRLASFLHLSTFAT